MNAEGFVVVVVFCVCPSLLLGYDKTKLVMQEVCFLPVLSTSGSFVQLFRNDISEDKDRKEDT